MQSSIILQLLVSKVTFSVYTRFKNFIHQFARPVAAVNSCKHIGSMQHICNLYIASVVVATPALPCMQPRHDKEISW